VSLARKARAELVARAKAEIERRRQTPEYRAEVKRRIAADLHEKQAEVLRALEDGNRFVALTCSRRAGKTHLLASLIVYRLLDAGFGQEVVFAAPTLARGKELIWQEVCRLLDKYFLAWQRWDNTAKIRTPAGAIFRITGLDTKRAIGKNRGGDTILFAADECQEFPHLLEDLMVAVGPALTQRRGWFVASGTPGPTLRGYWHEITHGAAGFVAKNWNLTQNSKLGRPGEEILEEELIRNGWTRDHPTFKRELLGLWVEDYTLQVCEFERKKNVVSELEGYSLAWRHFIGVDYGFAPDPCAWVVLAAHPHKNLVAVVHVEKHHRLTSDQIAEKTQALAQQYKPKAIVGDSASGGATFINDWNMRYGRLAGVTMRAAEKFDKAGSIDMMNTELRTSRVLLLSPAAEPLALEMESLQWKDAEHTDILSGPKFPDHAFDAFRYVLRAARGYLAKAAVGEPTEADRERQRQEDRNKRAAAPTRFGLRH
jgi:hypothetical protein